MGALELAGLVDKWWRDRLLDMADEDGLLDAGLVMGCTQVRSHLEPFPPEGGSVRPSCGHVARRFSPPDAGPAA